MKYLRLVPADANLVNPNLDKPSVFKSVATGKVEYFGIVVNAGQPNDEIWYTTTDGNKFSVGGDEYGMQGYIDALHDWYVTSYAGPAIVSETYENGVWKIKFASDVTRVGASVTDVTDCAGDTIYPLFDGFEVGTNILTVSLPSSVTIIDNIAFRGCDSMTSVTIPSGVTRIESQVFMLNGMESLTIPVSVTYLGEGLFYESAMRELNYEGTKEQWYAITKHTDWNDSGSSSEPLAITTVHCSDGDLTGDAIKTKPLFDTSDANYDTFDELFKD